MLVRRRDLWDTAAPERIVQARPLLIAALGSLSLPFVAYAFGANITGVYNSRYALPGTLGVILLMCCAVEFFPWKAVTVPLAALALGLEGFQLEQTPVPFPRFEHAFEHMPGTAPVVFAEGLYFFQAKEEQALTREQRARIVYLTMPQGWRFGDPTNENLALRSLSMFPELPVYPAETYLHGRQCFFVYDTHFSSDDLSYFLGQAALVPVTTDVVDGATVQRFCPKGAEPQR